MKNSLLLAFTPFLFLTLFTISANSAYGLNLENIQEELIKFPDLEKVPVFPGCDKYNSTNSDLRRCMSSKISKFVQTNFRTSITKRLGLSGRQRISVIFKINKKGNVFGVRARAPHPRLEKEAIRVVNMLPKMKPGIHNGKAVVVPYSIPIIFQVRD
jgi:protein TonB